MYKFSIFLISLVIFLGGCTPTTVVDVPTKTKKSNKKLFPQEDTLILFALRAEEIGDFTSAGQIFNDLYEKTARKEYIHRSLRNDLYLKKNEKVINRINALDKSLADDYVLMRLKIISLIQLDRLNEAESSALELVEKSKEVNDYTLVSDIYIAQKKFDIAVKYLESAYSEDYNEHILDKMSIILYVNLQRKKEAIAQLETHTRVHGCSIVTCKRLIAFYGNEDDINGLLSAYLRYYEIDSSPELAEKIIQLYGYKKEYLKLMLFLQDSHSDNDMLLQLYINSKNYIKAFPLARQLYNETGDSRYLAESVIYEYESQVDKESQIFLKNISLKFEELLKQDNNHLYLNYYGYILIEHEVDIKKGMFYVNKALKKEPNSSFYLDSLAWGHYKLGACEKSLDMIERVITLEGGDDPEVMKHYEIIKKCKGKK